MFFQIRLNKQNEKKTYGAVWAVGIEFKLIVTFWAFVGSVKCWFWFGRIDGRRTTFLFDLFNEVGGA